MLATAMARVEANAAWFRAFCSAASALPVENLVGRGVRVLSRLEGSEGIGSRRRTLGLGLGEHRRRLGQLAGKRRIGRARVERGLGRLDVRLGGSQFGGYLRPRVVERLGLILDRVEELAGLGYRFLGGACGAGRGDVVRRRLRQSRLARLDLILGELRPACPPPRRCP